MDESTYWMVVCVGLTYLCWRTHAVAFLTVVGFGAAYLLSMPPPPCDAPPPADAASARAVALATPEEEADEHYRVSTPPRKRSFIHTTEERQRLLRALFDEMRH